MKDDERATALAQRIEEAKQAFAKAGQVMAEVLRMHPEQKDEIRAQCAQMIVQATGKNLPEVLALMKEFFPDETTAR